MTRDGERELPFFGATRTLGASVWHNVALLRAWLHWALKEGIVGRSSRNWDDTLATQEMVTVEWIDL